MSQQYLQYNPSECMDNACGDCLTYCPIDCISLDPLTITPNCIECELCISNCPKGEKVLRMAYNDELGGGWISPFGYRAESKGESSETTPSSPNESESSTDSSASEKDNEQESNKEPSKEDSSSTEEKDEGNSSQESQGESKGDSNFTPADKAKLEALKNALLSAPPPPTKYNQAQRL